MRRIPPDRMERLVATATRVFIAQGYRRTQMADVAAELGVAKGTVYGYVESKEALLRLCLERAENPSGGDVAIPLPYPSPRPGQIGDIVRRGIADWRIEPLAAACEHAAADDIVTELTGVLFALYDAIETNSVGIKLIEKVGDHPEVFDAWQTSGRRESRQVLRHYFELRAGAGQLRAMANPGLAVRYAIESLTTWALHIKWDSLPETYEPAEVRNYVVHQVASGLLLDHDRKRLEEPSS